MNDTSKYDDIINLPHHQSVTHAHMSNYDRSAQFAPFAALKGYEEEIEEVKRTTDSQIELSDSQLEQINETLNELKEIIKEQPIIEICYFIKDEKKSGGKYITVQQKVKKIYEHEKKLILVDREIEFSNIFRIELI